MIVTGISAAFAPAPDSPPFYVELPARVEGGEVVRTAAADRMAAALPLAQLAEHADALRSLRGLAFDTALDDEFAHIPLATKTFSDSLEALRCRTCTRCTRETTGTGCGNGWRRDPAVDRRAARALSERSRKRDTSSIGKSGFRGRDGAGGVRPPTRRLLRVSPGWG